ncbi:MAG: beta strand repeat-containing protein, partial [Halobaculum sp.]
MNGRVSSLVVVVVTVLTVTAPVAGATTVGGGGSAADATATQSAVGEIGADEAVDSTQAAVGPADVAPSDLAGNGTEADPYVITNVSELQAIEDDLDAHYVLGSDIDASNTSNWNRGLGFDPIARGGSDVFTGTFDGAGHTISGLYISRSFERHVGIFGVVGSAGRVGNVTLADLDVAGNRTNVTYNTGGLVATNNGTVHNVTVTGTVAGASDTGSVVGYSSGPVRDISGSPTVIGTNVAGGFVGRLDGARLSNVTTTGVTVVGEVPEDAEGIATILSTIGGVVGETESGSAIENVTVTDVNVTTNRSQDPRRIGGLVGENHGPITDVSVTGEVDGWFYVGGVVGITNARVDNVTADVRVTGTNSVGGLLGSTAGDPDSPMLVDATVSGFVNGTAAQIGGAIGANSGLVRNVTSNATVVTDEGSTIGGLVGNNGGTLTDVSASGRVVSNDEDVGGLVGVNAGTVEDATAATRVAGNTGTTRTAGADNVGGLVGTNYGTIRNASATGYVTGSENVGGLVGNHQDGVIKLAIAYGDVFGSLSRAGGLVGFQDGGDINNTAAHGNVTGNDSVGGLIGELSPRADAAFTEKSFATGRVRGNTSLGGVVGAGDGAFNSYWDVETTNQTTTAGDLSEFQDADGLRTDQMTGAAAETNMTELSFGDIWLTRPDDYPTLAIRPNRSTAPGDGAVWNRSSTVTPSASTARSNRASSSRRSASPTRWSASVAS